MTSTPSSQKPARARLLSRQVIGTALLGCWLGLSLFAYSQRLHHWLHHAASHHAHQCALVSLVQGVSVEAGGLPDLIPTPPLFFSQSSFPPRDFRWRAIPDHRLPFSCGPPITTSVS